MKISMIVSAAAILALTAGTSLAAPCNTGASAGQQTSNDRNSRVDPGAKNLAGGEQPASPGTVGAMNNVGANQGLGDKQGAAAATSTSREDPASKNLAGGQQPASPGTVGALNNAGQDQGLGKKDDNC